MRSSDFRALCLVCALAACSGGGGGGGGGGGTTPQFGTVSGSVTRNGTGVEGLTVSVSGGGSTTTNAAGQFTLSNVATGSRSVSVSLPAGHIAADHNGETVNVQVSANQTATVNFAIVRGVVVNAAGVAFSPQNVTVQAGSVVRWIGGVGGPHTVTPDNAAQAGSWTSATLNAGTVFQHTFAAAATHGYHCQPHAAAGMTGTVTVTP